MRTVIALLLAAAAVAFLSWRDTAVTQASQVITQPQPAPGPNDLQAVTLIFGSKDPQPTQWDGEVSIDRGTIVRVSGYHFSENCKVSGNSWQCGTIPWAQFSGGMHPNEKPQPRATSVEPFGVTVEFKAPADASLTVKVPRGEFSFRPMDIPETEGIFPLQAMVEVYRTPVMEQITGGEYEDDFPSLAVEGDTLWVAWQSYKDRADRVFLRKRESGVWGNAVEVTEKPGDIYGAAVTAVGGKVTVIWSEREAPGWHLKARDYEGGRFGGVETLTAGEGNHILHRAAADSQGNLHVAYQSARKGRSDIYVRSRTGGKWSGEIQLSDPKRDARANDWGPAIAAGKDGTVWVAWDGYAGGNYNVYLRPVRKGKAGELLKVTGSPRFHAHPAIAVDASNRVWVAYDEAPENWGKDVGFLLTGGTGLYDSRTIKVAVYADGKWMTPLRQPGEVVPYAFRRYFHTPRIAVDSAGRIWLAARPRTSARLPTTLWAAGGKWETVATYYSGDRWSELILMPGSVGRNEGEFQVAPDANGGLHAVVVTDHRMWSTVNFGAAPRNHDLLITRLTGHSAKPAELAARPPEEPGALPTEPREREQVARLRAYAIQNSGKTYRIYRGDWHRHTDLSMDGAGDGSLFDSYRYAMDAAALDWLAVTDHQSGTSEYTWWRTQKSADMFHVPGFFVGMFGTERSLPYPNGHRNLMFAQRGVPILPIRPGEQKGAENTGSILYPFLKKHNGVAASHTSHTNMGTDWRDNDPALEPVVEIFQGARTNAEHEGAPLAPTEKRTELHAGGYRPLGYWWKALEKGYKLGVQASSDHVSTHTSYAMILAESYTREGIVQAIRERHTYGATSNILLDFRISAGEKSYIQGDAGPADSAPELTAKIHGTGPLKEVVVVRDNQYIYKQTPSGETYDLRYREASLAAGEHFYYVRVEQKDGNVAWSSPIWITRR
jgi:hypothetical protein